MSARRIFAQPARYAAIAPYLWLVLFFLVPFGFVLKISLSQTAIAQPPYLPLFDLTEGWAAIKAAFAQLSLDNFRLLVSDNLYISVLSAQPRRRRDLDVDPAAGRLSHRLRHGAAPQRWQPIAMMLVILPFWTSFLIRVYAWIGILKHEACSTSPARAASGLDAGGVALDRHRDLYRHRLFLSAVHGAAALRDAGEDGRDAARGRGRSRRAAAGRRSG